MGEKKLRSMDDKAQISLLEVILVTGMILMALYLIKTQEISSSELIESESRFETVANSVLTNLASKSDPYGEYASLLARYISDETGEAGFLKAYISSSFPIGTMYKILRINYSKLFTNGSASFNDCVTPLYEPGVWIEDDARVSRIVSADGYVYEIVLCVWFNIG